MTRSPLTDRVYETDKHSSRHGNAITQVNIHHAASTSNSGVPRYLAESDLNISTHQVLLTTAEWVSMVEEQFRAWTTSYWYADKNAITIEVVNDRGAPHWTVNEKQLEALAEFIADVATRYDWPEITRKQVRAHREYKATFCPGDFLYGKFDDIVARANQIWSSPSHHEALAFLDAVVTAVVNGELGTDAEVLNHFVSNGTPEKTIWGIMQEVTRRRAAAGSPAPKPETTKPPRPAPTSQVNRAKEISGFFKLLDGVVTGIINGDFGNDPERTRRLKDLGFNDEVIQKIKEEVNRRLRRR